MKTTLNEYYQHYYKMLVKVHLDVKKGGVILEVLFKQSREHCFREPFTLYSADSAPLLPLLSESLFLSSALLPWPDIKVLTTIMPFSPHFKFLIQIFC